MGLLRLIQILDWYGVGDPIEDVANLLSTLFLYAMSITIIIIIIIIVINMKKKKREKIK